MSLVKIVTQVDATAELLREQLRDQLRAEHSNLYPLEVLQAYIQRLESYSDIDKQVEIITPGQVARDIVIDPYSYLAHCGLYVFNRKYFQDVDDISDHVQRRGYLLHINTVHNVVYHIPD